MKRQLGHALAAVLAIATATWAIAAPPSLSREERGARSEAAPAPRVTLPCTVVNVVDGDTVDVEVRLVVRVRLLADDARGTWAPESRTLDLDEKKRGLAAKENMRRLAEGKQGLLDVPITSDRLIDAMTLERLLAVVYVDGRSLGAQQIKQKFASSTKGGVLGK